MRSATLLNTLVDFSEPGSARAFRRRDDGRAGSRRGWRRSGYLPADQMAGTFNLLRANDLIWRYVAAGWLMGESPPAFDILAWNDDATRMPARMHSEYLHSMYLENRLATGTLEIGGRAVSSRRRARPSVRRLGAGGPHHALAWLLPHDPARRRARAVRAHLVRSHRRDRQPARPEAQTLHQRRARRRTR